MQPATTWVANTASALGHRTSNSPAAADSECRHQVTRATGLTQPRAVITAIPRPRRKPRHNTGHTCRPQTVCTWSTSTLVYPFQFVAVHWRRPQGEQQRQQASAKDIVCCTGCIKGPLKSMCPKSTSLKGRDFLMVMHGHNLATPVKFLSLLFFEGISMKRAHKALKPFLRTK